MLGYWDIWPHFKAWDSTIEFILIMYLQESWHHWGSACGNVGAQPGPQAARMYTPFHKHYMSHDQHFFGQSPTLYKEQLWKQKIHYYHGLLECTALCRSLDSCTWIWHWPIKQRVITSPLYPSLKYIGQSEIQMLQRMSSNLQKRCNQEPRCYSTVCP